MDDGLAHQASEAETETAVRDGYDWSETRPSTAVVETVTHAQGREPTSTEPLYETIDPDALDSLVGTPERESIRRDITVEFGFDGHRVTVGNDGTVLARPM